MNVLYLILFGLVLFLLLLDAISPSFVPGTRGRHFSVKLLPLALFFWVLVLFIQTAQSV